MDTTCSGGVYPLLIPYEICYCIFINEIFHIIAVTISDLLYWPLFRNVLIFYLCNTPTPQNNVAVKENQILTGYVQRFVVS